MIFAISGWPHGKSERKKYLDHVEELKKQLWNKKVTVIQILTGAFGTVTQGVAKRLEGLKIRWRLKTIQT